MQSRKLIYHIFPANILVTIGAMLAIIWYGSSTLQKFYIDESRASLLARAYSIENQVQLLLDENDIYALREFIQNTAKKTSSRITLIDPIGIVISDSLKDPDSMDNHRNRPEIMEAAKKGIGSSIRFSQTLGERMLYTTISLRQDGEEDKETQSWLLRIAVSMDKLEKTLARVKKDMAAAMVLVIIIAACVTIYVSRRITRPLEKIIQGAERFAVGEFSPHLIPPDNVATEIATLSLALNSMADQLEDRIGKAIDRKNELQTVLDSMLAAVLTVDNDSNIISLNSAASKILNLDSGRSIGKPVQELIRNIDLLQLIERTKHSDQPLEDEIKISTQEGKYFLHTNCIHLYDKDNKSFGLLLVLHDVTKMRLLENMRKDFVANVSHELKTPITTIKGFIETVLDDKLEDREMSIHFLETALRKTDHLNAIIDNLLLLSRIEQDAEAEKIELHFEPLKPVLTEAIHCCTAMATEKQIRLQLECPDNLLLKMHSVLLEQAVVNLIVNAVRYSHRESEILIRAERKMEEKQDQILILVQDFGIGIGAEHLPRLFERFYRSDRARSRKIGGTGLGLAIVKHIAQAHKGDVEVKSEAGKGTSVCIILPS